MSLFSELSEVLTIWSTLKLARLAIKDAPIGAEVDCGIARGVEAFGRTLDVPLRPIIRK